MGLEKAIEHGKEHRKPYRDSRVFFMSCRNHGGCEWCQGNRLYSSKKRAEAMRSREEEYEEATRTMQGLHV
jgi:hypothetical protein